MKQKSLSHILHTLGGSFRRCATRFPLAVAFVLALTAYQLWLVLTGWKPEDRLFVALSYYLSVGAVLSLSLHLWAEEVRRKRLRLVVQAVAQALLVLDAVYLYHSLDEGGDIGIGIAHFAGVVAIGLSVFFLSFFREKDDIPSWNFAQTAVGILALTVIVGMVMSGGLCLLALSLEQLFGVDVSYKCYAGIVILCSELLPLLMFLGLLPGGESKHDRVPQPTAFLRNIIRYLFLPLAGLYLLVLYVYAATIIVRWELPDGWVSWLVTVLMAGCIGIEYGLYPSRVKGHQPADERIARWLPVLILPLLVLMTVGIGRRFLDYGITLNRLYLATLNGWFYMVCIGLVIGKARRISWIPVSFSLVFLLTSVLPVNYASITRNALRQDIKAALGGQQLPLSEAQYEARLQSVAPDEAGRINGKLMYLGDWYGKESTRDLVDGDISFYPYDVTVEADTVAVEEDGFYYHAKCPYTLSLPQGCRYCTALDEVGTGDSRAYRIPLGEDARLVPDTLCLPVDTLRSRDLQGELPPPVLCTQRGNIFVLTDFQSVYGITEDDEENPGVRHHLEVTGLLFHNEAASPQDVPDNIH